MGGLDDDSYNGTLNDNFEQTYIHKFHMNVAFLQYDSKNAVSILQEFEIFFRTHHIAFVCD